MIYVYVLLTLNEMNYFFHVFTVVISVSLYNKGCQVYID